MTRLLMGSMSAAPDDLSRFFMTPVSATTDATVFSTLQKNSASCLGEASGGSLIALMSALPAASKSFVIVPGGNALPSSVRNCLKAASYACLSPAVALRSSSRLPLIASNLLACSSSVRRVPLPAMIMRLAAWQLPCCSTASMSGSSLAFSTSLSMAGPRSAFRFP